MPNNDRRRVNSMAQWMADQVGRMDVEEASNNSSTADIIDWHPYNATDRPQVTYYQESRDMSAAAAIFGARYEESREEDISMPRCNRCDRSEQGMVQVDGGGGDLRHSAFTYCHRCLRDLTCAECGMTCIGNEADHMMTVMNVEFGRRQRICRYCFTDSYHACYFCGCHELTSTMRRVHYRSSNRHVCSACHELSANCSICEQYVPLSRTTSDDERICTNCADRHRTCRNCNRVIITADEQGYHSNYCPTCEERRKYEVKGYCYKPFPVFNNMKGERTKLYFGIEVETDNGGDEIYDEATRIMKETECFIYAKEDASIDGLEFVTHPLSWGWMKKNPEFMKPVFDLTHNGYRSHEAERSCGMHVHLSTAAFSGLHLLKFLKLFYDNAQLVKFISQRANEDLMEWARISLEDEGYNMMRIVKERCMNNRHTAVAVNETTVEVRVFRGTLRMDRFWKNLEFCKAAYDFSMKGGLGEMNTSCFADFIARRRGVYRNLYKFFVEKKFTATTAMAS